jgi:hypothetical protein
MRLSSEMRTSSLLAVALLAFVACDSSDEPSNPGDKPAGAEPAKRPSENEPPPSTKTEVEPAKDAPVIVVHDPGQQPRVRLRIAPTAGTQEAFELRMDMGMSISLGSMGQQPRVEMPTMITEADLDITQVDGGMIEYSAAFGAPRLEPGSQLPPPVLENLERELAAIGGTRGTFRVSDRGLLESGSLDIPDNVNAQSRQMMEQMTQNMRQIAIPLPPEPVGPGAKWEATTRIELGGLDLKQRAEYQLVGCEQTLCKLQVSIEQSTEAEQFAPPQMPTMKAKILEYESHGVGTVALDLNHVTPDESTVGVSTHFAFEIDGLGDPQQMVMDMDLDMTIRRTEHG